MVNNCWNLWKFISLNTQYKLIIQIKTIKCNRWRITAAKATKITLICLNKGTHFIYSPSYFIRQQYCILNNLFLLV